MTAPKFGDTQIIRNLDPRQKIINEGIEVPNQVLACRGCGGNLYASLDDTWIDGDTWGAGTINLDCVNEPDLELEAWEEWDANHQPDSTTGYQDGLDDCVKVEKWLNSLYPTFKNEC